MSCRLLCVFLNIIWISVWLVFLLFGSYTNISSISLLNINLICLCSDTISILNSLTLSKYISSFILISAYNLSVTHRSWTVTDNTYSVYHNDLPPLENDSSEEYSLNIVEFRS